MKALNYYLIAVVAVMIAVAVAVVSEAGISKYIVSAAICFSVMMSIFAVNGYRKYRSKGALYRVVTIIALTLFTIIMAIIKQ